MTLARATGLSLSLAVLGSLLDVGPTGAAQAAGAVPVQHTRLCAAEGSRVR